MKNLLNIGLMLLITAPVQADASLSAQERMAVKAQLYKKCLRGECNDIEKAAVYADFKRAGKYAGALLLVAAVAIGVKIAPILVRQQRIAQARKETLARVTQAESQEWLEEAWQEEQRRKRAGKKKRVTFAPTARVKEFDEEREVATIFDPKEKPKRRTRR